MLGYYEGGSYLGHNIAAIAVDARGRVIDFDFNHNELFNSSVEHAESRLLRRLFSLTQLFESWEPARHAADSSANGNPSATFLVAMSLGPKDAAGAEAQDGTQPQAHAQAAPRRTGYGSLLSDVTIYTSLESCAQCSGTMTLADVREVVYLQPDPTQYLVGNLLWRATRTTGYGPRAPESVPASRAGVAAFGALDRANREFAERVRKEPFFRRGSSTTGVSITSFLCTDAARAVMREAADEFHDFVVAHPTYVRPSRDDKAVPGGLTNAEVLEETHQFLEYVRNEGQRGTPHRA
jgi:tRNA(Arg) A34 adenosine deaminase TadA